MLSLRLQRYRNKWKYSTIIPLYKNKGDAQNCNYRDIKLLSHTIKLRERVIEGRLRATIEISENQFGFRSGRSTIKAIQLIVGGWSFIGVGKGTFIWYLLT